MSYNPNFYSNFSHSTFQRPSFTQPPPPLPHYYVPPVRPSLSDQDFVKQFDNVPMIPIKYKSPSKLSINQVKQKLRDLVLVLNDLKEKECFLKDNIDALSDEDWALKLTEIDASKTLINTSMSQINDTYLDSLRKLLTKRSAKRLRLKRIAQERKKENENRIKDLKEKSRKIDENLQKIKDDINKAKQEEEQKLEADMILKETLRKKLDARKCLAKLDALLKLYKARRNTARGRGEQPSERDLEIFSTNIDKLKSLWTKKLHQYESEESDLRGKLKRDRDMQSEVSERDAVVRDNLARWRRVLFGQDAPQREFQDVGGFVNVRSQWDQFISPDGTSLPVGWVLPNLHDT